MPNGNLCAMGEGVSIDDIRAHAAAIADALAQMPLQDRVSALNLVRAKLHTVSPFRTHPVDLVLWVPAESVEANDYNPNTVAPPEMKLLELSIQEDGYTQPVV